MTQQFTLSFTNLSYIITQKKFFGYLPGTSKRILHNVSGHISPGELLVILGPSGSGKSTLLNILTGSISDYTGSLQLNGAPINFDTVRHDIGYVRQEEVLIPNLTVRQNLEYTAELRLPSTLRSKQVEEVITQLGLTECQHTRVGSPQDSLMGSNVRGISGGERKRACIANELLTNPSLLFLDEPTSGLDSSTALSLMKTVKKVVNDGRTVIMTLHQPSSEMYELFDKLMLLVDGRPAYFGPASDAVNYFASLGYICPAYHNPADFFLSKLTDSESKERLKERFLEHYRQPTDNNLPQIIGRNYTANWWSQFTILFRRGIFLNLQGYNPAVIVPPIFTAVLIGLLWWQLKLTTVNNR